MTCMFKVIKGGGVGWLVDWCSVVWSESLYRPPGRLLRPGIRSPGSSHPTTHLKHQTTAASVGPRASVLAATHRPLQLTAQRR